MFFCWLTLNRYVPTPPVVPESCWVTTGVPITPVPETAAPLTIVPDPTAVTVMMSLEIEPVTENVEAAIPEVVAVTAAVVVPAARKLAAPVPSVAKAF